MTSDSTGFPGAADSVKAASHELSMSPRSPERIRRRVAGAIIAAAMAVCCLTGCAASTLKLRIDNESGKTLRNMKVTYTGGMVAVAQIKVGKSFKAAIAPTGASPLEIEFQLEAGEAKKSTINGVLEPNMAGEVILKVIENGGVGWETHLSPGKVATPKGVLTPK